MEPGPETLTYSIRVYLLSDMDEDSLGIILLAASGKQNILC